MTKPETSSDPRAEDGKRAARRRLGASFAAGGELYERLRPGYPVEAVTWMVDGVPSTGSVADIGAGTGKLTAALISRGFDVTAVDPSEDMLAQLHRRIPGVRTHLGTGEATGLAKGTIDLATFAQSWHWVEPAAGCTELARLLTRGGRAGWIWNFMDVRVGWVAELADIWHTVAGAEATDWARNVPVLSADFEPADSITVDWTEPMRREDLAALVTTRSYYLNATSSEQRQIRDDVDAFLGAQFPADDEVIDLPYRTHTYRARRR